MKVGFAIKDPCAVNKFASEEEAITHAQAWSKHPSHRGEWTVIHAPSESGGTAFFVEKGDGGMIATATERYVGTWENGKKVAL